MPAACQQHASSMPAAAAEAAMTQAASARLHCAIHKAASSRSG
jgi:hypothetical protein